MNTAYGDTPQLLWSVPPGEPPVGRPAIADGALLVASQASDPSIQRSTLRALSLDDGNLRWQRSFEHALVSGLAVAPTFTFSNTPEVWVLIATASTDLIRGEGALLALDATTGEQRTYWSPGVQRVSAPALVLPAHSTTRSDAPSYPTVCVTTEPHTLTIFDLATGRPRTEIDLEANASLSAPALARGVIYIPCRSPHLLAVDLGGRLLWQFDAGESSDTWLDKTPLVVMDRVIAALSTGAVIALRAVDGSLLWRRDVGPPGIPLSSPATDGERLFIGAHDGLHALALRDGHAAWEFPTQRRIAAPPILAKGVVYATCHDHHLYALNSVTGQELWRHRVGRRIEIPPVLAHCGEPATPCVLIADRSGTLTMVTCPTSAKKQVPELPTADDEPLQIAAALEATGELERAAEQYTAAGAWQQAAQLWLALDQPTRHAEALKSHARSLAGVSSSDEERAAAWRAAAQVFDAEGLTEQVDACQREVARCLSLPIITMDVQFSQGLVLDAWSTLQFVVRNDGYGPAYQLILRARGDQFEGQLTATREIITLRADRQRQDRLDVRPRQYGDHVPLRVSVEYQDHAGNGHSRNHTIYLAVAQTKDLRRTGKTINVIVSGRDVEKSRQREAASIRRRLNIKSEHLLLIEERQSKFILDTDIPLNLIKEERDTRREIEELETRLDRLESRVPTDIDSEEGPTSPHLSERTLNT